MNHADLLQLGAAALSGGILTRLLDPALVWVAKKLWGRKQEQREETAAELKEADIMSRISKQLREELLQEKLIQDETIKTLRKVIINLTDLLDGVFPRIQGITDEEKTKLKMANLEARLAGLAA